MDFKILNTPEIRRFIKENEGADTADLALRSLPCETWPVQLILGQIKARQKAAHKMPSWYENEGVVFPDADVVEQASSEGTARFKASIVSGERFVDLTAGVGVDSWAFLGNFREGIGIESDTHRAEILGHNMDLFYPDRYRVLNKKAEDAIGELPDCSLIYIDPARRNNRKRGLKFFSDMSPNVLELLPTLKKKCCFVMLKTSPYTDINGALAELGVHVSDVYCIEWRGTCREVLFIIDFNGLQESVLTVHAVSLAEDGSVDHRLDIGVAMEKNLDAGYSLPQKYLYEPGPAFLKADIPASIAKSYNVTQIHPHTHLYTSNEYIEAFPGRAFEIVGQGPARKKDIKSSRGHLKVRNFPMQTEALKKKLGLKDGGEDYFFACTLINGEKVLLHCRKSK